MLSLGSLALSSLLTGEFVIRYPDLPRSGPQPDGDTIKFAPDSPSLVESKSMKLYLGSFAQTRYAGMTEVAATIADVQVRNQGTIGGSLAEADPSGDWGAALLALPAEVSCVGPAGDRTIPISDFFLDAYTTALAPGEAHKALVAEDPEAAARLRPTRASSASSCRCAPASGVHAG